MGLKRAGRRPSKRTVISYRRTLVGLKRHPRATRDRPRRLQTNPCGVEAFSTSLRRNMQGYRRTLVGLKREADGSTRCWHRVLQTNPCGVEALSIRLTPRSDSPLQTNPCGVEAKRLHNGPTPSHLLQTNPCGVEAHTRRLVCRVYLCYRRTLVGLKRETPPLWYTNQRVTDEPLWG